MQKEYKVLNKIVWVLTLLLFSSITIFESYTWGKYVLIFVCFLILLVDLIIKRGKYPIYLGKYHLFFSVLIIYTFCSSLWAINPSDPLTKTFTFIQILFCMSIVYNHFYKFENINQLLSILKWASYIISIYSLVYYGYDFIVSMMKSGVRIDNTYTNINIIGMYAAIGIVIQIDEIVRNKRFKISSIFCIPSFIMVIATQSRKALLMLIIGILLDLIIHNLQNKKFITNLIKIAVIILSAVFILSFLSNFEIFDGINSRMDYLVSMFTGKGDIGASARTRKNMIELGIQIFKENPIFGIGVGCPHVVAADAINFDAYLHNGFVEMLAGGGIVGFVIYYGSYLYLILNYLKFKNFQDETYKICVVLLVLFLFRDYALVSTYDKATYFYFLIFFMELNSLKRKKLTYN